MFNSLSSARLVLMVRLLVLVLAAISIGIMPVLAQDPAQERHSPS